MSFETALQKTLEHEGGYSNDLADRGGATMYGITEAVARDNGYTGNMRDLPESLAREIYRKNYWDINRLDEVSAISSAIAEILFDIGVNMGTARAAQFFQEALTALNRDGQLYPDLKIDGVLGSKTIAALRSISASDHEMLLKMINCLRGNAYIDICMSVPDQRKFIRGWFKRVL